jgi:hypothetical protein
MNATEWKNQAGLLRKAAIKASEPIDRDVLFTLAEDCESQAARLERAKAAASQRRLGQARPGIEQQNRIRQWRMKAEELRTAADCMTDPMARAGMRNAAATYETMADSAEQADTPDERSKAG